MRVAEKTWEKETAWRDTLALLQQAERLAPPYSAPARFTRIAEQWLSVWRSGQTLFAGNERVNPMQDPERRRFATYLTASLSGLDEQAATSR